ncbi:methyltransferase domain-containing protein [Ichthyenterobacterium sp. W332]|uniref:Methyltransferase domain-containing protein n=1 Tax=Microcosmobacter mediterraneus TaxID=3075607 RepID=A0ABU2YJM9_9FLAO|nr:methyltransferase domain-containing protein [Ichthyenterobacterium sp. W332]MDT0557263.1 methyltransferase domain-containing protein [Ichthyenterobacterium sp. W332]
MSQQETNAYILGTETAELHRLGLQHQVWSSEAIKGWELAGFTAGQTLLDLGCGPGFCTKELAYITGQDGKVIGIDKSAHYITFLNVVSKQFNLNIETQCCDFEDMDLQPNSIDGVFDRWALAWVNNPKSVLKQLHTALKPGAKVVTQEYFDWSTLQTEPNFPRLTKAIKAALQSFQDQNGMIDIGRNLPVYFRDCGYEVIHTRPLTKMVTPKEFAWQWPKSFFHIYFPKLVGAGYLTQTEVDDALLDFITLEQRPEATIFTPAMREVIAKKI